MEFSLTIWIAGRGYKMNVEQIYQDGLIEKYKVTGGKRSIVLSNNRPFLKAKGLRRKKPEWKLEQGAYNSVEGLALTIEAIEHELIRVAKLEEENSKP